MAGESMFEREIVHLLERSDSGSRDKAVEHDRDRALSGRESRAENGGKLATAERCGDRQRVAQQCSMPRERAIDHVLLALERLIIEAGAAPRPAQAAAAQ